MKITGNTTGKPAESTIVLIEDEKKTIQDELAAVKKEFEEYQKNAERRLTLAHKKGYREALLGVDRMKPTRIVFLLVSIFCFLCIPWYATMIYSQLMEQGVAIKLERILIMKDCAGGQLLNKTLL